MSVSVQSSVRVYLESNKAHYGISDSHKVFRFAKPILAKEGHSITLSMIDMEMPISYYLINSNNDAVVVAGTTYTIPSGQYDAESLAKYLTANTPLTVAYDTVTNKYVFTGSGSFEQGTTAKDLLGVDVGTVIGTVSPRQCNLGGVTNVYVKVPNISLHNLDSYGRQTQILSKVVVDESFGSVLHYSDYHTDFKNVLDDTHVESIEIMLVDTDNRSLGGSEGFHGIPWSMTLVFDFIPTVDVPMSGEETLSLLIERLDRKQM